MPAIVYYLVVINLISATLFYADKIKAKHQTERIPEFTLHLCELLGGVFINVILMHTIRHKNRKIRYGIITCMILLLWIAGISFFMISQYNS
ncbi:MAG: DUF1294 domain-containing protein [Bacteroidales bacterium]